MKERGTAKREGRIYQIPLHKNWNIPRETKSRNIGIEKDKFQIDNVQTRGILKTSEFTRSICKNR